MRLTVEAFGRTLLDLAFQWASGVLGAGDVLPNLNPR